MEEERWWGAKENTISVMLVGATEPNPPRLTLDASLQWCSPDSQLSLWFFLLFFEDFFNLLELSNPVTLSGVPKTAPCQSMFWVKLLTWTWSPKARSCP